MSNQVQQTANATGTAVITGASSGLGREYAYRLADRGYDLLLIARRGDRLEALAKEIRESHGPEVRTLVADLTSGADLERVANVLATDSSVTLLINNAGTALMASTDQTPVPALAT